MTDPHDPRLPTDELDPLDELASAHLDGQTTPEEAARVDADPDLVARVARLAAARAVVRAAPVEPPGAARRDALLTAALEAFDAAAAPVGATAPVTPIVSRWRATRRTFQLAGIAAAVALLALAVPLLGRLDSGTEGDRSDEAATALSEREAGSAADSAAPEDATAGADSTTTFAVPAPVDLGGFADLDELAAAVRAHLPATDQTSSPEAATTYTPLPGCAAEATGPDPAPHFSALATLGGRAVVVVVRDSADGGAVLEVLDASSCALLSSTAL